MIQLDQLSKRLGTVQAIDGITMAIPRAIVFGLLGPNGAGKTTLIRMLAGLITPTTGSITLFGDSAPGRPRALRRIGYMPQAAALYPGLSIRENLRFSGRLYGVAEPQLSRRSEEVLDLVELGQRRNDLVGTLSGGMVRRVMLASTMMHQPELLILDEPTAGVDPLLRLKFWEWFERLRQGGTTILVSTHHISEAVRCQRVIFLRLGRVLEDGPPRELMAKYRTNDLEAAFVEATRLEHEPRANGRGE